MELFELGVVVSQAFNDPKELKKLDPDRAAVERVLEQLESGELPAMLRIPKKNPKPAESPVETNGE